MIQRSINRTGWLWQWVAIGATVIACLTSAMPAMAAIQEISVLGQAVDSSPNKAQAAALEYARKRAVYLLMSKMKIDDAEARAAALTPAQLGRIIRGADIRQAKREGDVTYLDVTVSIVDTILRHELSLDLDDASDAATALRGILVLPVLVIGEHPYVWEKENTLRLAIREEVSKLSYGAVVVPSGDFDDLRLIDHRNVLTVKGVDIKPMFERYGVDEIIIAVATQQAQGSEEPAVILLRRLTPDNVRVEQITLPPAPASESSEERLNEITDAIAGATVQIAASTSHQQQAALSAATQIPIVFRYGSMREIAKMQTILRNAEGVMQLAIPKIDLQAMQGVLYLSGDKDVVRKALAKKGLFVKDYNGGWMVSLR